MGVGICHAFSASINMTLWFFFFSMLMWQITFIFECWTRTSNFYNLTGLPTNRLNRNCAFYITLETLLKGSFVTFSTVIESNGILQPWKNIVEVSCEHLRIRNGIYLCQPKKSGNFYWHLERKHSIIVEVSLHWRALIKFFL